VLQLRTGKGAKVKTETVIGLHSLVRQADNLVGCDLDGETMLMSVGEGKYYGMEPIGSRIWALMETTRSVSEICNMLLSEFEVEREQCEREVLVFLNDLAQENLVLVVDESVA
jgi:hypothetical protein